MANIITEKQKKEIKRDYLVRLLSVCFIISSLLGVFFLAYVIPYYISIIQKDIRVTDQFASVINAENIENVGESVSRIVNKTLAQLDVIELYNNGDLSPSVYLSKIIENKNSDIQLSKLSYNKIGNSQGSFSISGVSDSRESLVIFIEALKTGAGFTNVEIPVSNFAKDSNVAFTLTIEI